MKKFVVRPLTGAEVVVQGSKLDYDKATRLLVIYNGVDVVAAFPMEHIIGAVQVDKIAD